MARAQKCAASVDRQRPGVQPLQGADRTGKIGGQAITQPEIKPDRSRAACARGSVFAGISPPTNKSMKTIRKLFFAAAVSVVACASAPLHGQVTDPGTTTTKFSGTVVDVEGKPVAGAAVEHWQYDENKANPYLADPSEVKKQTATSDASGAFSFQISSTVGIVLAKKPGLAPAWKLLRRTPNSPSEPENKLVMMPPGILAGTVVDESNKPVPDAEAYVVLALGERFQSSGVMTLFGKHARDLFSARTDSAGHFRIENFPTNAVARLAVDSPGKVSRPPEDESHDFESAGYRAGQQDIKLVIEPAGTIEGQVVGENGTPIPAVQLTLSPDSPQGFMASSPNEKSGTNGTFHFRQVLAGSYRIQAFFGTGNDSGWVAEAVPVSVTAGQSTRGVQIKAVRGALLEVTVLNEANSKPQSKVNVTAMLEGESRFSAVSDSNGVARMYVLPGEYRLMAFRQPNSSGQASATVEGGKTNRAELELAEIAARQSGSGSATKISGVAHRPDGQPAAGASVQLVGSYGPSSEDLRTDSNGRFELQWNPRQFDGQSESIACVLVRDAERNLAVAQDLDEDTTNLVLRLGPGLTLAGRAESSGKPLTNATAQLVFWSGRRGMWLRGMARTNTPGQFEIPALPPGRKYGVVVSAPGYGQKQNHQLEISAEPGRQELDTVELKPANLRLAGQVLDADDKPVVRCNVSLYGEDQPSANTRTDSNGRFAFARVCEGTVRLSANSQRAYGNVVAEGGDTNVILRLGENMGYGSDSKQHKLRGVVTDPEGKPVEGVQVAVFPNNGARWAKTSTNGEYSLNWSLQPWQMQNGGALLVLRDKVRNLAGTEEVPEEATNLNVKLKPALVFTGQVKNAEATPMTTAQVGLWLKAGNSYDQLNEQAQIPVNAEGRFEIPCLPPEAAYLVYASAKGYGKSQQQLEPEYETNRLELAPFILNPANSLIAGQVLRDDDKPAAGVNVNLNGEGQPDANITTDSKGRFKFNVCEGQIRLYAYSQNGSGSAQATVEAGDTNIVITLGSVSGMIRQAPRRAPLTGSPLPDLATVNLASDVVPSGRPVLLCLFDAAQRPSRYVIKQLEQQASSLRQQNVSVLGIQATITSDDIFNEWKGASPVSFPVGRVTENTAKSKWASSVSVLPWLILADSNHRVIAEGFAPGELGAQIQKLTK